ncbi:MAG TPA: HDOD domain-containing protein [Polyangiaceae bacterium]|nr:HDOD domain-containing protein [Polyangiaceae bacterium]
MTRHFVSTPSTRPGTDSVLPARQTGADSIVPGRKSEVPVTLAPLASGIVRPRMPAEPTIREAPLSFLPAPSIPPGAAQDAPRVEPVSRVETVPPGPETDLERELVRQLRTGRAALPVLPQVAESALRLANDPDARIDELARLVDTDPPIAARFMSVANSVAYWRGWLTASTQSAIVRLGLANTRDLLFQVVYAASTNGLKKFQAAVQRSFKRSVVAAVAARTAAKELSMSGEYDYMSGLLHDIGEARVYRILDGISQAGNDRNLLKTLVQKYHCVAGAEVAMAWKLPSEIVDACAAHHDESSAATPHVRLVMIADCVVQMIEARAASQPDNYAGFERLGVSPELARTLVEKTRKGVGSQNTPGR